MTPLLELRDVSRSFGALRAVDAVSLTIDAGARHALIGPNGAGKSTLFRLVSGGLRPTSGQVLHYGRDVTRMPEHRRARLGLAQTFQHSSLFSTMTCLENVALGLQRVRGMGAVALGPGRVALEHDAAALLTKAGLAGRERTIVGSLAHGERRQLEVAVALATEPGLLLLDEPAAGMSPAETERFAALIGELPAAMSVVLIEHDLDVVFQLAATVTVLHLGKVLATGTPREIKASPVVQQAYLGTGVRKKLFVEH